MANSRFFNNNGGNNPRRPVQPVVKNPELEELIKKYLAAKDLTVLDEITKKLKDATVFVPMIRNDEKKIAFPAVLKNQEGNEFLAVYTCREQMVTAPKTGAEAALPFEAVLKMAAGSKNENSGIAINPFTQNLIIKKKLIDLMAEGKSVLDDAAAKKTVVKQVQLTEEQAQQLERIKFEYRTLPQKFFEDPAGLMDAIAEEKEDKIDALYEESYANPRLYLYRTDEFHIFQFRPEDDVRVVRVDMPERQMVQACAAKAYMILKGEESYYFLISLVKNKEYNLIQITGDLKQANLGVAPTEGQDLYVILQKCGIEML